METTKKRFIAGAVCPHCKKMDKIVTYKLDNKEFRECVACGFKDELIFKPIIKELETRTNKSSREKQTEIQIIKPPI